LGIRVVFGFFFRISRDRLRREGILLFSFSSKVKIENQIRNRSEESERLASNSGRIQSFSVDQEKLNERAKKRSALFFLFHHKVMTTADVIDITSGFSKEVQGTCLLC
jgi:hypothetical protein